MFNLAKGTKVSLELFDRLSLLQDDISTWLHEGSQPDLHIDSRSTSHMISAELDFLKRLDTAFDHEDDGYDVLRGVRDAYAALHVRGRRLQTTLKEIIALRCSKGHILSLLDALTDLAEVAFIYSSREQRLNALLVRWCTADSEKVQVALREVRSCLRGLLKRHNHS